MFEQSNLMRLGCHPDKGDGGACEEMINYLISYTFRMAISKNPRKLLRAECKKILCFFLGINIEDNKTLNIIRVSPTKQWNKIDLIVDIVLQKNDKLEYHALMIEIKYFSSLKNDLTEYTLKSKQFNFYKDSEEKRIWHYWLFHCRSEEDTKDYIDHLPCNFRIVNKQYFENIGISKTESEIFNEFWINNWVTNSFEEE